MANTLLHIFFDVDMRSSHPGLIKCAGRKVNIHKLNDGECVIFLNRAQNRVKMFAGSHEALLYVSKAHRIDPEAIRLLPKYLSGTELNYDAALKEAITTHMERRHGKSSPPKPRKKPARNG